MNEINVKTIKSEPALLEFNYEEIEKTLDENLKKYSGLTFTEDDATECKSTIAELRKAKKAVDQYRLKTKKELSAPITEFENKCKQLDNKFDQVIIPLVEQHESFEVKRKKEKQVKVEEVIAQAIEQYDLLQKFAIELVVDNSYLAKSKTMKSINEEINTQASHLKMKQDKEESDKLLIASHVELINERYNVSLPVNAYVGALEYKEVEQIKENIEGDAEAEKVKRELKEKQELERQALKEKKELEELEKEKQVVIEEPKLMVDDVNFDDVIEPFDPLPDFPTVFGEEDKKTVAEEEKTVFEVYKAIGTSEQLESLEKFMTENNITWEVIDNE